MDISVKVQEKNNENNELIKKEQTTNSIEPIETIQSSFKGNSNYDKRKNFQQIHHKPNHFNYNNHQYNQSYFQNTNTMNKNRKGSIKYQNYSKNLNIDNKNKNNNYFKKKRNQDIIHNNDHNSLINDNKLVFINPYKEADDLSNYKNEFQKIGNLNFLKQNWKQRRSPEEENNDINTGLNLNLLANLQNQNLNNINYPSLLKLNYNQPMNLLNLGNLGNLGNIQMNNFYLNLNKQNMNNIQNNVASPNKVSKNNNKIINPLLNFPMNSINLNSNNIASLNSNKINAINNNPLSNISNMVMMYNQMNNTKYKNMPIHPPQNNQIAVTQNNLPNETTKNKSPQKINHMNNNLNNLSLINNNNLTNQVNNSFNSLIQFYFNTLQYQQIILNKMSQLFNSNNNNNANIHTDIQNTINQLKTILNNEMNQLSPILSQNQNSNNNISNNNTNNNSKNIDDNNNSKENEKNNDKYIQNILSTWPKQKFVKPYSPLLKLDKNQNSLKSTNFIYNPLNSNNNTLNINTMTYSNLAGVNPNQNFFLNNEKEYNKMIDNYYDDKKIEELLKIGKCLTGVFRMNKLQQNHGYITVPGINNDILVRNKNLYKCLNLDEVIVELFNFSQWKSLANKKTVYISHVNEEGLYNNATNNLNIDDNKNIKGKSLDEEEENLKTKEERTNYINKKLFHLRPEGRIIKILKSPNREKQLVCKIEIDKNKILAVPIDEAIPKIYITIRNLSKEEITNIDYNNYKLYIANEFEKDYINYKKKYFRVKIHSFASSNIYKGPLGYIVNEIGESGDIDTETVVLLGQYNAEYPENFSEEIMNEVKNKLKEIKITDEYIKNTKRKDFRNELIFTIDPYTSKDLDDAIHVKIIDEETQLLEIGVHIADPTTYVEENSLLDKEALFRATSVYLVQKKIPMLPLILSDDICSIMPKKDTLAISCIFRISLKTRRLDESFKPYFCLSVVNSKAKWDYDLVQKIIENKEVNYNDLKFEDGSKPDSEEIFLKLKSSVEILYQLTKLVRKDRFESGSLMIDNDDIYFDLDENNKPKDFHISVKNESHNLIEELMLISNFLCAKYIKDNLNQYSLIRRHPFFNDNKFNEIQRYFSTNKIDPLAFDVPTEINKLLLKIKKENYNKYLCIQHKLKFFILRAEYIFADHLGPDELKHSSLNLDLYTHFTSPIRRYPDCIVHRQLKEIFKFENKEIDSSDFKKFEKYNSSIDHINERYNSARLISQKSKRLFQYIYLKSAPKKLYTALIMDIILKNNTKKGINNSNTNNSSNNFGNINNNSNYLNNNNNDEEDLYLILFVPELNLELEWRKSDNNDIIYITYDKNKNEICIDYMIDSECKNKDLRAFDALQVELISADTIPIEIKCKIDFTK